LQQTSLSIRQASAQLEVSPDTIRRRLKTGALTGQKINGTWQIILPESPTRATEGDEKLVAALEARITAQDHVIQAQAMQIGELLVIVRQTQAMLPAPHRPWWRLW